MCRQQALLALRRSVLPATPIRSSRKSELIADVAAECDTPANRQHIFAEVLVNWSMHELRLFIARLRGLGYMVPVGQRPRKQDLIAAIVSAGECTATAPTVSKRTRKDICSSAGVAEQLGLRADGVQRLRGPRVSNRASVLHGIGSVGFGSRPSQAPAEVVQALA